MTQREARPRMGAEHRHPLSPAYPADAFAGTAADYARYRPRYPAQLVAALRERIGGDGTGRLLDLACGTGEVARALQGAFAEVWAVDREPEMIAVAERLGRDTGLVEVRWFVGRAEELAAPPRHFRAITAGRAFHRLDKPVIMPRIRAWLEPGGCFADLGSDSNVSQPNEPWLEIVAETVARWTPDARAPHPAAPAQVEQRMTTREVLRAHGFTDIEEHGVLVPHTWSLDEFVGYLFSRSVTSRAVFGGDAAAFETDLRERLLRHDPRGAYTENLRAHWVLGRASHTG